MFIKKFCNTLKFKDLDNLNSEEKNYIKKLLSILILKKSIIIPEKIKILELLYSYFFKEKDELSSTWVKKQTIGKPGKEGTGYIVYKKGDQSIEYVMKEFKEKKSFSKVREEVKFQIIASLYGLSPVIYEYGKKPRPYIIMDKMNGGTIIDVIKKQKGKLTLKQQQELIDILKKLDEIGIIHGDDNLNNLMFNNGKLYIIDFGMSTFKKGKYSNFDTLDVMMTTLFTFKYYLLKPPILFMPYLKMNKKFWEDKINLEKT